MEKTDPNTARSLAEDFIRTVEDLSQYLSVQKKLGNSEFQLSDAALKTIETWGTPAWFCHGFAAQGPENARIMIIDSLGSFFEGPAGDLLTKILKAMHLTPGQVYICNTSDYGRIRTQVKQHHPNVIITLGEKAGGLLLGRNDSLKAFRGQFHTFMDIPLMATHHPEALIENPRLNRQVWDDMQLVMKQAAL